MKKPNNRRSNRSSVADSSPKSAIHDDEQQQPHCDNRADVLEKENEALKREIEDMKNKLATVSPNSIEKHKEDDDDDNSINSQKFIALEEQVMQLRKKLSVFSQLSAQKQISSSQKKKFGGGGEATLNEIQRLKAQKVQLLCKMKLESVQFRLSRASLEKQVLQLKKDHRRKDYEMRKLLALNEKQKLVLQRKTEEASMATKRLKDLLESRKASSDRTGQDAKSSQSLGVHGIELELKIDARVEDIRADYERQMEEMADEVLKYEEEAEMLREENFKCQLQQKEVDCMVRESELRELKEEVFNLSNVVNQLGIPKAKVHMKRLDVDPVKPCVSSGSSSYYSFQSEDFGGNNVVLGKSTERVCCSCSKRSLCKTSKCECLAAFGSCGTGCGCTASKCKNRKDDSLQQGVAKDTAQSSANTETVVGIAVSQASDMDNDNLLRRKPLSEIGNTVVNPSPKKPGKKTRGRKPVCQLDMEESSSLIPETAERTNMAVAVTVKPTRLTRAKRSAV